MTGKKEVENVWPTSPITLITIDISRSFPRNQRMQRLLSIALCLLISACTSNSARIDELAHAAKLQRAEIEVDGLRSIVYTRATSSDSRLVVFLEGDG